MSCLVSFALNQVRCEEHGACENYKMKICISRGVLLEMEMHCSERNVPNNFLAEFIFGSQVPRKTYVASFRSRRMVPVFAQDVCCLTWMLGLGMYLNIVNSILNQLFQHTCIYVSYIQSPVSNYVIHAVNWLFTS